MALNFVDIFDFEGPSSMLPDPPPPNLLLGHGPSSMASWAGGAYKQVCILERIHARMFDTSMQAGEDASTVYM
jgi:hypothetical protein